MAAPDPDERLVFDADGNIEIPNDRGEVLTYLWEVAPPGLDDFRVVLRRVDAKGGPYEVTRTPGGRWRCTCADTHFGRARRELRNCKHRYALQKLWIVRGRLNHARADDDPQEEAR